MEYDKITTVKLKKSTKKRLAKFGCKEDTYDDVINNLIDIAENKD